MLEPLLAGALEQPDDLQAMPDELQVAMERPACTHSYEQAEALQVSFCADCHLPCIPQTCAAISADHFCFRMQVCGFGVR